MTLNLNEKWRRKSLRVRSIETFVLYCCPSCDWNEYIFNKLRMDEYLIETGTFSESNVHVEMGDEIIESTYIWNRLIDRGWHPKAGKFQTSGSILFHSSPNYCFLDKTQFQLVCKSFRFSLCFLWRH